MVKAKTYVLKEYFQGFPKPTDIHLEEEELPEIQQDEFLAEAIYLSVDPYMRKYVARQPLNSIMVGTQVARITESKNPKFPVGRHVMARFGWRSHTIHNGEPDGAGVAPFLLPEDDMGDLPLSLAIGMLGMPGSSAYFGLLETIHPKTGETLIVSGAAGAVGSHVGQIGKIKGLKVIGIAGSDEKGEWLTKDLGFDHFINYKTDDIDKKLREYAPGGVELYFDNVGGEVTTQVLKNMKTFGRISACGSIADYNEQIPKASMIQPAMVFNQLMMQGFQCMHYKNRWDEAFKQNLEWLKEGKLKYKETVTEGFENMFDAFVNMLKGGNVGKAIVKV
ncbi:prostaglandin reductase 1-like [Anthonomus grandis grandis]|uniref:prostaglandin reductase 1-like n=1 Tax=Anthonomus grandis grandis TaxID=2921223 RepID=UPI00216574C6|nr:prostaglandin reductase 1-like [Anthonomus grandis grandis]